MSKNTSYAQFEQNLSKLWIFENSSFPIYGAKSWNSLIIMNMVFIPELNKVNTSFGLKEVSESNINKIRRRSFEEYDAKKLGDNFAWCSSCDKYHSL